MTAYANAGASQGSATQVDKPIPGGWTRTYAGLAASPLPRPLQLSLQRFYAYVDQLHRVGRAQHGLVHPGWDALGYRLQLGRTQAKAHMRALQRLGLVTLARAGGGRRRRPARRGFEGRAHTWCVTRLGAELVRGIASAVMELRSLFPGGIRVGNRPPSSVLVHTNPVGIRLLQDQSGPAGPSQGAGHPGGAPSGATPAGSNHTAASVMTTVTQAVQSRLRALAASIGSKRPAAPTPPGTPPPSAAVAGAGASPVDCPLGDACPHGARQNWGHGPWCRPPPVGLQAEGGAP